MPHDATKVVLGASRSSDKAVTEYPVDPAGFLAGLGVSLASTGLPTLLASAGPRIGISMGRSLSDVAQTAVMRAGEQVPVRAALKRSTGLITITNVTNLAAGDTLTVGATGFVGQSGAATPGAATFQATSTTAVTATNLASQINAHATAGALVYAVASAATVRLYAKVKGAGVGNDVAVSYTDASPTSVGLTLSELSAGKLAGGSDLVSGIDYAAIGAKVYINDVTGEADVGMTGFSTITDAVCVNAPVTGIDEDGSATIPCLIVDMPGGL